MQYDFLKPIVYLISVHFLDEFISMNATISFDSNNHNLRLRLDLFPGLHAEELN